jgi:dolichyl-phosphate beta-glucosyltransferase
MRNTKLSIVIPAFNEAVRLPPSLHRIGTYLREDPTLLPAEVLVVDDGSSDATAETAAAVQMPDGIDLKVLVHPSNRGKGAAVRSGFSTTTGAWVLLTDADLSAPIDELKVLLAAAAADRVVIGSRAVDRRLIENPQPWYRDLMGRTFNLGVRSLALGDLHDTQCGFKLFPGDLARALAPSQRLDGFAFDVELLVLARWWGYAIREVGVRWRHVDASRVSPIRHSSQMMRDLLRLWWWRSAGRLPVRPGNQT